MNGTQLKQILRETFTEVPDKYRENEFCILCPDCDDHSGHRSVNLRTGLTNCFKCNRGGHIKSWLKARGVDLEDGVSAFQTNETTIAPSRSFMTQPEMMKPGVLMGSKSEANTITINPSISIISPQVIGCKMLGLPSTSKSEPS